MAQCDTMDASSKVTSKALDDLGMDHDLDVGIIAWVQEIYTVDLESFFIYAES
jgi:hypothetical protein